MISMFYEHAARTEHTYHDVLEYAARTEHTTYHDQTYLVYTCQHFSVLSVVRPT